jgi:hypothetical protein
VTEPELHQRRAELWRVNGNPVRTLEDSGRFFDAVGFCLMYPVRLLPVMPTFLGAYAGSAADLSDAKHAFADPRNKPAMELLVRLLRERRAYEVNLLPENSVVFSAGLFPFFYALLGDRKPRSAPRFKAQGERLSPLATKVFETIEKHGPVSKRQLQELISRELSTAALDRALNELWSILKITRVDYREQEGAYWDLLYRWSPKAVIEGAQISIPEALSALIGKYLQAVVAAGKEEIEQFFSHLAPRSKVQEAVHALLAARELSFVTIGNKNLIHLAWAQEIHANANRAYGGRGGIKHRSRAHE